MANYYLLFHYRQLTIQGERPMTLQNITDHMIFAYYGTGFATREVTKIFSLSIEKNRLSN